MIIRQSENMSSEVQLEMDSCEGVDEESMAAVNLKAGQKGGVVDHVHTFVQGIGERTFLMGFGNVDNECEGAIPMGAVQARWKGGAVDCIHTFFVQDIGGTSLQGSGLAGAADSEQVTIVVIAG
jgi:hypothetical protein